MPYNTPAIAQHLREAIGIGPLMALGASSFTHGCFIHGRFAFDRRPGMQFTARILPFRKDGTRAIRPRNMTVTVTLDSDTGPLTYSVTVTYLSRGRFPELVTHYQGRGIPAADMSRLMLALDSDTDHNPLNPRLYPRQ